MCSAAHATFARQSLMNVRYAWILYYICSIVGELFHLHFSFLFLSLSPSASSMRRGDNYMHSFGHIWCLKNFIRPRLTIIRMTMNMNTEQWTFLIDIFVRVSPFSLCERAYIVKSSGNRKCITFKHIDNHIANHVQHIDHVGNRLFLSFFAEQRESVCCVVKRNAENKIQFIVMLWILLDRTSDLFLYDVEQWKQRSCVMYRIRPRCRSSRLCHVFSVTITKWSLSLNWKISHHHLIYYAASS